MASKALHTTPPGLGIGTCKKEGDRLPVLLFLVQLVVLKTCAAGQFSSCTVWDSPTEAAIPTVLANASARGLLRRRSGQDKGACKLDDGDNA